MPQQGPLRKAFEDLKASRITRREFIARASALGVAAPISAFIVNSIGIESVSAQDATAARPTVGTEGQTRGAGGELKILQWQSATHAFGHLGQGTKDSLASCLVLEPLISYTPDGVLIPNLVDEVPSLENGLLSEDLTQVTFNISEGLVWSDGEPVTAEDAVFTWEWVTEESNSSTSFGLWEPVTNAEALDELQVQFTFAEATLAWFATLAGAYTGMIIPKHVWDGNDAETVNTEFLTNPIGTGPYVVESFQENDQAIYVINENYRDPNKPYFSTVNLKGGGDATSAAQAVLQTGDWHMAWNLQVEPEILDQMAAEGGRGSLYSAPPTNVERLLFQFADPNTEVDGERSHISTEHPAFSDIAVRQAIAMSVDRETIASQLYGEGHDPGRNWVTGIAELESPNTEWTYDLEGAAQLLEDAGWVMDGNIRAKDGVELSFDYVTSINSVRQKNQAIVKDALSQIGIDVTLGQVDSGVFFDSAAGNEQNYPHFYADILMYTSGPTSTFPIEFMLNYYSGEVSQGSNNWSGNNNQRYVNPDYDVLYEELLVTTDPERAAELFIQMNDIVIEDFVIVPEVSRAAEVYAYSNDLVPDNVAGSSWEPLYWNIANWTAVE